jgi:hypothetical protein
MISGNTRRSLPLPFADVTFVTFDFPISGQKI